MLYTFRWLKLESRLVELDALVKSNLSLTRADPDRCLAHLDEISTLTIDPLMLKKHPQVVETIKKVNLYSFAVYRCVNESVAPVLK
jgi:hypothetical protein